jgi:hypothetical protein
LVLVVTALLAPFSLLLPSSLLLLSVLLLLLLPLWLFLFLLSVSLLFLLSSSLVLLVAGVAFAFAAAVAIIVVIVVTDLLELDLRSKRRGWVAVSWMDKCKTPAEQWRMGGATSTLLASSTCSAPKSVSWRLGMIG